MLLLTASIAPVGWAAHGGGSGSGSAGSAPASGSATGSTPGQAVGSPTGSMPGQSLGSPTGSTPGQITGSPAGPLPGTGESVGIGGGSRLSSPPLSQRRTTARLRRAIFSDPDLAVFDIQILPLAGRFQLEGNVDTQEQKDRITLLAARVAGNGNVDNEITIGLFPPGAEPSGPPPGVDAARVDPNGTVPNQDLGAIGDRPFPENNTQPRLKGPMRGLSKTDLSDRMLAGRVRRALYADPKLAGFSDAVHVLATNGRVVLRGQVASQRANDQIDARTRALAGPENVDNQLVVRSPRIRGPR